MQQRTHQSRTPSHEAELRRSLNASADGETAVRAFCFELPAGADGAPEWIPYLPAPTADGKLVGEDGRAWTIEDARALAAQIKRKLPIDINHANDVAAPAGKPSPAVGWITAFEVRADGSTWAKADWNKRGLNAIAEKEYGFISAAFDHTKTNVIKRYAGASLVNHPNFTMPALNSRQSHEEEPMSKAILAALGLPETATEQQAVDKIAANSTELQRATNAAQNPDVTRFVPRADHDAVVTRATNAEKRVTELEGAQLQKDIDAAISDALKAGKITPATEKYHRANCAKEGGLAAFREYVAAATPVIDNEETRRAAVKQGDGKDPQELANRALNYQKQQADLGRAVSIADAMTHVTAADKQ